MMREIGPIGDPVESNRGRCALHPIDEEIPKWKDPALISFALAAIVSGLVLLFRLLGANG